MGSGYYFIKFSQRDWSFGTSRPAEFLNWITATWLRFNTLVLTGVVLVSALVLPGFTIAERAVMTLLSPLLGLVMYPLWKITIFTLLWIPVINILAALLKIFYYKVFSWIVAERAPKIIFPLWK